MDKVPFKWGNFVNVVGVSGLVSGNHAPSSLSECPEEEKRCGVLLKSFSDPCPK